MQPNLANAANFIWLNARLLDRHRFGGNKDGVLNALRAYQNRDGGFGNGLEPDLRAPTSQPQPVEFALHILDEIGAFDDAMVSQACDYLVGISTPAGGVPSVLPSAGEYPCAPWWRLEPDAEPPASLNPTAAIAGLLHKHHVRHHWRTSATEFCWAAIERNEASNGYDFVCVFTFLEHVPDRARAEAAWQVQAERLRTSSELTLDPDAQGHVFMPLDFAPTPSSPQRRLFAEDVIERHLDGLARAQQPDGGWPISWEPPSVLAELEWRASRTLRALDLLRAYGRVS